MDDKLAALLIYIGFLLMSYGFIKLMLKMNTIWFIVFLMVYLGSIVIYFEFINQFIDDLRDRKIYIAFGHANFELVMLSIFCFFNYFIVIGYLLFKRG